MTRRENFLRAARFESPESIPMIFVYNGSCWPIYPHDALIEMMADHPYLFPNFEPKSFTPPVFNQKPGDLTTDEWGIVWETGYPGMMGGLAKSPLAEWAAFDDWTPPAPDLNAEHEGKRLADAYSAGEMRVGGLDHGHTFLRYTYLRGYENAIFDMADDEPRMHRLLGILEDYNRQVVAHHLACGVDWMSYPEDLGMQVGPMLSPEYLRRYLKPSYTRLMAPAKEAGCVIHMHSDGDIRDLVDDLVVSGVQVVNLQDLVNGLDWIKANLWGKVAIDLDIDRQSVVTFGTPAEIDALIRHEVELLGSEQGGLMMIYGMYPGVPLENARALMDAMERYAGFYA
jgi:hypothetical protein